MLRIKEQKPSLLGSDYGTGSAVSLLISKDEINTQIEILKSRSVLEEVIVQLDLVERYKSRKDLTPEEGLLASLDEVEKRPLGQQYPQYPVDQDRHSIERSDSCGPGGQHAVSELHREKCRDQDGEKRTPCWRSFLSRPSWSVRR